MSLWKRIVKLPAIGQGTLNPTGRRATFSSSATLRLPEIYDVVCVGGGPAGLSLLSALRSSRATSHLKVALIESQSLAPKQNFADVTTYSNRCSSLTPATTEFLDDIGAWKHINKHRVQPYDSMRVWDGVSGARITFDWDTPERRTIANMIENNNLTASLAARAHELGGMALLDNARVHDVALGEDGPEADMSSWPIVTLADGKTMAARLLVGADGPNSLVRTFAGITSRGWDYDRHGVVATVRLERYDEMFKHEPIAYQRFLPSGPVAMLPLPNGFASIVWSTLPSRAGLLKSLAPLDITSMVNAAFRLSPVDLDYLHTIPSGQTDEIAWREQHTPMDRALTPPRIVDVLAGSVASFPLRMRHVDTYIGERVALVGDAAHTIHPLAGQGLNQGQGDIQALVETIKEAVQSGQDIGSLLALESYNARRYAANNLLLGVVDKLHKLYSVGSGPLVGLRSWGLSAVNAVTPLKTFFMQQAAGNGRAV